MRPGQFVSVTLPDRLEVTGLVLEPDLIEMGSAGLLVDVGTEIVVDGLRAVVVGFERRPREALANAWPSALAGWQVRLSWLRPELKQHGTGDAG